MAGLVLSSTLLGQLLFFEITGGCSWALISYYQSDKAQRSALKALLITHIGSLGLYLAAATLFLQTGTFALSAMSELHGDARYLVYGGILFAAWGNRPSYRCKRGYRMQWKRQHRSAPISTPHRW